MWLKNGVRKKVLFIRITIWGLGCTMSCQLVVQQIKYLNLMKIPRRYVWSISVSIYIRQRIGVFLLPTVQADKIFHSKTMRNSLLFSFKEIVFLTLRCFYRVNRMDREPFSYAQDVAIQYSHNHSAMENFILFCRIGNFQVNKQFVT